jgi:hypothetical protein
MDPVQELLAIEAIKQVKARYCRHLDAEDWDAFRALFADDADFLAESRPFAGADAFVAGVVRHHTLAKVRTVHHCHMPEIALHDATHASGTWAMYDYVDRIWAGDGRREAFAGYGHYAETYVATGGGWRIASMTLTRLRVDPLEPGSLPPFPERGVPVAGVLPA